MRIPPKELKPGEWQTDEHGKRFRIVGNIKEYELEIHGVPQSVFLERQRKQKERDKERLAEEQRKTKENAALRRNCPFRDCMKNDCTREACALFIDGCTFAALTPEKDTEGLQCPISKYKSKCRTDCALYKKGCTLTGIKALNKVIERTTKNE